MRRPSTEHGCVRWRPHPWLSFPHPARRRQRSHDQPKRGALARHAVQQRQRSAELLRPISARAPGPGRCHRRPSGSMHSLARTVRTGTNDDPAAMPMPVSVTSIVQRSPSASRVTLSATPTRPARGELDGVRHQVDQNLSQSIAIGADRRRALRAPRRPASRDSSRRLSTLEAGKHLLHELDHGHGLRIQHDLAGRRAGPDRAGRQAARARPGRWLRAGATSCDRFVRAPGHVEASRLAKPSIAVIGVRISWLTLRKKDVLGVVGAFGHDAPALRALRRRAPWPNRARPPAR